MVLSHLTFKEIAERIRLLWPDMGPRLAFYVSVIAKIPQRGKVGIDNELTIGFFLYYSKDWNTPEAKEIKAELKAKLKNRK